jgi:type I restriction enzyme S subunit
VSGWPALKHIARLEYGEALAQEVRNEGGIPVFGSNGVVGLHDQANMLAPAIVVGRKGSFGKVTWSEAPGFCIDTAYYIDRRVTGTNLRWLYWALQTLGLDEHSEDTGVPGLSREKAYQSKLRLPTPSEQDRIANFLDAQMARIDALIAEKERLQAAVTDLFRARLGTAVVEGIGARRRLAAAPNKGFSLVREDWALVPLKHLASSSGGLTPSKDNMDFWGGAIPWVSPKDMKRFVLHGSEDHITEAALAATSLKLHPVGSVLVVVRGMILAHTFPVATNAVPVTINQDMKALRAIGRVSAQYLAWMLRGLQPLILSLTEESAHGTKALRTDQWVNQPVPVPSTEEQNALVAQFEKWEEETNELSAHVGGHIARLREYRSSLISAAVTGQIDIGNYDRKSA